MKLLIILCLLFNISCKETSESMSRVENISNKEDSKTDIQTKNVSCEERTLCPKLKEMDEKCSESYKEEYCKVLVDTFKLLTVRGSCMRSFDTQPVPAIWTCGVEGQYPSTFDNSVSTLNKILSRFDFARDFFSSEAFRSVLSGETAEAYLNKSLALRHESKQIKIKPEELFTKNNYSKLKKLPKGELLYLRVTDRVLIYQFLDIDAPKNSIKGMIVDYKHIAKLIVLDHDSLGISKYLVFISRTSGSADEVRSHGLAHLYSEMNEEFLYELSLLDKSSQIVVIEQVAFGLLNTKTEVKAKVYNHKELNKKIVDLYNKYKN